MFIAIIILGAVALALAALCVVSQRRHEAATANLNYQLDDLNARIAKLQGENAALMAEKSSLDAALQQVQLNLQRERVATERLTSEKSELLSQTAALRERVALNESEREKREQAANDRFRNLANEIFSAHTASFRLSSEQRIQEILDPLKANIDDFRKAVTTAYSDEAKERFSLQNELRNLMELNKSIGKEAQELTRALKGDSKVQGDWGEMILERMLEMSGLSKDVHFRTQVKTNTDGTKLTSEDGRDLRPDVVVFYPDDRCVVIDSKVSLSAYIDYVNAAPDSPEFIDAGKRHLISLRRHIDELAQKRYQDLVGEKRLDFVMMFIPNEGAYLATMHLDQSVWQEAYNKRVLLTSPTHLIAVLRMLEQLWKQDAINKNVQEIARLSGLMIDKIVNFTNDLDDIQKALTSANTAYDRARKRLCEGNGNVLVTAKKIVTLGAKASKAERLNHLAPTDLSDTDSNVAAIDSNLPARESDESENSAEIPGNSSTSSTNSTNKSV
jgi:DNA recombination protein RmuC